jgi:hypothetical protein
MPRLTVLTITIFGTVSICLSDYLTSPWLSKPQQHKVTLERGKTQCGVTGIMDTEFKSKTRFLDFTAYHQ